MIDRAGMIEPILDVYPDFRRHWDLFYEEWKDQPDELPQYILLSELVRECSDLLSNGHKEVVRKIFDVVDRWISEGDDYVREAAIIGFIEDLQNTNLHNRTKPEDFIPFLSDSSRPWWAEVQKFWDRLEQ